MTKRGGKREGAGRPQGSINLSTITKSQAREATRVAIQKHVDRMLRSQIAHACGIGHVYTRDKSGKFTKIESEQEGNRLLTEGEQDKDYWIFFKDPSVQAFTDLMNRAQDKPREQEIEIKVTHELEVVPMRLAEARKRLALAAGQLQSLAIATQPAIAIEATASQTGPATGPATELQQAIWSTHAGQAAIPVGQPGEAIDGEVVTAIAPVDAQLEPSLSPVSPAITAPGQAKGSDNPNE